jgi:hypothetical protein
MDSEWVGALGVGDGLVGGRQVCGHPRGRGVSALAVLGKDDVDRRGDSLDVARSDALGAKEQNPGRTPPSSERGPAPASTSSKDEPDRFSGQSETRSISTNRCPFQSAAERPSIASVSTVSSPTRRPFPRATSKGDQPGSPVLANSVQDVRIALDAASTLGLGDVSPRSSAEKSSPRRSKFPKVSGTSNPWQAPKAPPRAGAGRQTS